MSTPEADSNVIDNSIRDEDLSASLGEIGMNNFAPYLMNRIVARYNHSLAETLKDLSLTTPKMRVLSVLSVVNGPVIRELAIFSLVGPSTLSRVLDAMEADGLIRREAHEQDSRSCRVYLSDRGGAYYEKLWPKMSSEYQRMFAGTSREERAAFVNTLQKILRNIRVNQL